MIFDAISVAGVRLAYIDCRDELVSYCEHQDLEPHTCDEERGLHKLIKPLF